MAQNVNNDLNAMIQNLGRLKGVLTRRTNAFDALIGTGGYTEQDLIRARDQMIVACQNLRQELDRYVANGYPENHPHYLDGLARVNNCTNHYGPIYNARLQDFVRAQSIRESERLSILAPSQISSGAAASLLNELAVNQQLENAEFERQRREQQRAL